MHNSLAPQAAGSETVVGLSVVPKLSQRIWATWEPPEGCGAWGKACSLFGELASQKKDVKKVFLVAGRGRQEASSVCSGAPSAPTMFQTLG